MAPWLLWSAWLALSASAPLFTACHRSAEADEGVLVQQEITPQPAKVGLETITVSLSDAHGRGLSGARVTVEGDMSHPGMSPVMAEAKELPGGRYQASLPFGMAGDWVVLLHIKLAGGQVLERQLDVRGVRSN